MLLKNTLFFKKNLKIFCIYLFLNNNFEINSDKK